ncbi:MAG: M20 family metallo-hydrolase [Treponema sp.]|jgi:succinyl-diaminopimelate desuccinylase|nr:M20 family metallo-hydrolase [Treponema sp.]
MDTIATFIHDTTAGCIDTSVPLARELETELTKRPAIAPDSGGEGEIDKCEFLESWLMAHGITRLERFDAPDERAKKGIRPNLVATIPGQQDTQRLWIMSHLDVVPPGELKLWQSDPWTVILKEDGTLGPRFVGRGVEDNQQGLVSSVIAALALVKNNITPAYTVKLLFAADEEVGSAYGIHWLLKNKGYLFRKDDMVLIPDGGDPNGESIEIAEKNLLWLKLTTKGLQTHGSRPDQGNNAHLAGAYLAVALYEGLSCAFSAHNPLFEPDYSTFQPTKKEANVPNVNTIPGEDVFCMDMRILPQYPLEDVLTEIGIIKSGIEKRFGVTITWEILQRSESPATPEDSVFVKKLSKAIEDVYHVETRCIGIGGGTVAAPLRSMGIDAAVWSRIDGVAHQPNEYALIKNILGDAKVMALLMIGNERQQETRS